MLDKRLQCADSESAIAKHAQIADHKGQELLEGWIGELVLSEELWFDSLVHLANKADLDVGLLMMESFSACLLD